MFRFVGACCLKNKRLKLKELQTQDFQKKLILLKKNLRCVLRISFLSKNPTRHPLRRLKDYEGEISINEMSRSLCKSTPFPLDEKRRSRLRFKISLIEIPPLKLDLFLTSISFHKTHYKSIHGSQINTRVFHLLDRSFVNFLCLNLALNCFYPLVSLINYLIIHEVIAF